MTLELGLALFYGSCMETPCGEPPPPVEKTELSLTIGGWGLSTHEAQRSQGWRGQSQSQASDLGPGWIHAAPAHEVHLCLQMSLSTTFLGTGEGRDSSMRPGALCTEEEGILPGCWWLQAKGEFWFCYLLAG